MPFDPNVAAALANEARRKEATAEEAKYAGQVDAFASIAQALEMAAQDARRLLAKAREKKQSLELGAGPGVTDDYDRLSTTEQAARAERLPGKAAAIDYIQANPACSEADAVLAYEAAAQAARPGEPLVHSAAGLLKRYARNAKALGLVADDSWETFRAFVVATPRDELLGL